MYISTINENDICIISILFIHDYEYVKMKKAILLNWYTVNTQPLCFKLPWSILIST